ncbi:hypothetical protein F5Y14DRAFT_408466 [Nemania sp. NC0429]|nr:hypothetical protein F5Y14DRAFT_408466 [Nemania sp. NC0429]
MTSRKRARPNPPNTNSKDRDAQNTVVASLVPNTSSPGPPLTKPPSTKSSSTKSSATKPSRDAQRVRKADSWYGSWPRVSKSSASTQIARENIMGGTQRSGTAADFSRFDINKKEPSLDSDCPPTATLPTTEETEIGPRPEESQPPTGQQETANTSDGAGDATMTSEPVSSSRGSDEPPTTAENVSQAPVSSTGWLSWLSRPAAQPPGETATNNTATNNTATDQHPQEINESTEPQDPQVSPPSEPPQTTKQAGSWFGLWSSSANASTQMDIGQRSTDERAVVEETKAKENEDVVMKDAPTPSAPTPPPASAANQPSAGSTWAFWSRDTASRKAGEGTSSTEQGELAVMGDRSESNPRRSSMEIEQGSNNKNELPIKPSQETLPKSAPVKKSKRNRPQSMDIDEPPIARSSTPSSDVTSKSPSLKLATTSVPKVLPPNLLLPSLKSTYRMRENPSIMKQIAQLLLRTQQPPANHVFLSKDTPTMKKAVAIGVHGLFPASYLRPMIGQPTGTSIRFANHCAEAVRRWCESNGSGGCEIEKVALEGDGKIAERVENLWKLLLNWIEHIRNADLIMLACHSQGVPVGVMLLAKLIDMGIVTKSRIGVCAMAGVSLGPFPDYKSGMGMWMGSAAELWQFADPESEISKRYEHALKTVVEYGARITYVGSIDDQLVPLQSALYGPANHPYIFRAIFIDGRIHAPDFIAHLVGFALKLRNLGISDHGLIRELSVPLAGSLYSGEGHSRLYDDGQVYDLAISHTLETTGASGIPCEIQKHEGLTSSNPYVLPWIMRGLLEEDFVKTELSRETAELLKQFDDWAPATKALKDVKYRLEAVRSKL